MLLCNIMLSAPNGQQVPAQTESPSPYWSNTATNVHDLTSLPNYNIPAGSNFMMAANGINLSTSTYPQQEADGSNFQIGKRLRNTEPLPLPMQHFSPAFLGPLFPLLFSTFFKTYVTIYLFLWLGAANQYPPRQYPSFGGNRLFVSYFKRKLQ